MSDSSMCSQHMVINLILNFCCANVSDIGGCQQGDDGRCTHILASMCWPQTSSCCSIQHPVHQGLQLGQPSWEESSSFATLVLSHTCSANLERVERRVRNVYAICNHRTACVSEAQCMNVVWTQQLFHFQCHCNTHRISGMSVLIGPKKDMTSNILAVEDTDVTGVGRYSTRTSVQRCYKSAVR